MRLHFDLSWQLQQAGELPVVPMSLFRLLSEIAHDKNLREAAEACEISYRNAWGQIELWEKNFGNKLVVRQRGRGTKLTDLATALLETKAAVDEQLREALDTAAESASGHLTRLLATESSALRIVSSHHELINQFAGKLRESSARRISLDVIGSETALRRYQRADADICGFHIPTGPTFLKLAERFVGWLDESRDHIFYLEDRALGLISNPNMPVNKLVDLTDAATGQTNTEHAKRYRFINRQQGSATRLVFDNLLATQNLRSSSISGYEDEEHTHTAVAALVASGDRDVGFGEASAAEKFSLAFSPIVSERFYIALKRELQPAVQDEVSAFFKGYKPAQFKQTSINEMLDACKAV